MIAENFKTLNYIKAQRLDILSTGSIGIAPTRNCTQKGRNFFLALVGGSNPVGLYTFGELALLGSPNPILNKQKRIKFRGCNSTVTTF